MFGVVVGVLVAMYMCCVRVSFCVVAYLCRRVFACVRRYVRACARLCLLPSGRVFVRLPACFVGLLVCVCVCFSCAFLSLRSRVYCSRCACLLLSLSEVVCVWSVGCLCARLWIDWCLFI